MFTILSQEARSFKSTVISDASDINREIILCRLISLLLFDRLQKNKLHINVFIITKNNICIVII